jgi:hypothetical protein
MTPVVAQWIGMARDLQDQPVELVKFQSELGEQVLEFQDQCQEFEAELATATDTIRIAELETVIAHVRQGVRIVRAVGDGIAWRALKFDRALIRQLSDKNPSGGITRKGFEVEVETAMRDAKSTGRIVVLNDVTNCLRFADLTEVGAGSWRLVEVTGGRPSSEGPRKTRQKRAASARVELLRKELAPGPDGETVKLIHSDIVAKNHFPAVSDLIAQASKSGHADGRITPSVAVSVVCPSVLVDREIETTVRPINPCEQSSGEVTASTLDLFGRWAYNMAPIPIFPISDQHRAALLTGQLVVYSHLNINGVIRALRRRDLHVRLPDRATMEELGKLMPGQILKQEPKAVFTITHKKIPITMETSFVMFGRVWLEYLDEESIADLIESTFRKQPGLGYVFPRFANESTLWD